MPVGKEVQVVIVAQGQEVTKSVTLGRLEDGEKAMAKADDTSNADQTPAVAKRARPQLSPINDDARKTFKLKDGVKGVVVSGVEPNSPAARQGPAPRRRDRGGQSAGGREPADVAKAIAALEERGQEVGPAAGRQRRRRRALRRAGAELTRGAKRRARSCDVARAPARTQPCGRVVFSPYSAPTAPFDIFDGAW